MLGFGSRKTVPALTGKSFELVARAAAEDGTDMTPAEARVVFFTAKACGMEVTVQEDLATQVADNEAEADEHDESADSYDRKAEAHRGAAGRNRTRVGALGSLQDLLKPPAKTEAS